MDSNLVDNPEEKLTDDMQNLNVKVAKNWNDLPEEIKLECIKLMDFETRWSLHYTSKIEKKLVESTKCFGDALSLFNRYYTDQPSEYMMTCPTSELRFKLTHCDSSMLESLVRIGMFDYFDIRCNSKLFAKLQTVSLKTHIDIEELRLHGASKKDIEIVKNCRGLKTLIVHLSEEEIVDLLEVDQMIASLKTFCLYNCNVIKSDEIIQFIEKWISDDKEQGSVFKVGCLNEFSSSEITESVKKSFSERLEIIEDDQEHFGGQLYIPFGENKYIDVCVDENNGVSLEVVDKVTNEAESSEEDDSESDISYDSNYSYQRPRNHDGYDSDYDFFY